MKNTAVLLFFFLITSAAYSKSGDVASTERFSKSQPLALNWLELETFERESLSLYYQRLNDPESELINVKRGYSTNFFVANTLISNSTESTANKIFYFDWPTLDKIILYQVVKNGRGERTFEPLYDYSLSDTATYPIPYRRAIFPLTLLPNEHIELMVFVHSDGALNLASNVVPESEFWVLETSLNGMHMLFIGMLFVMVFYNFILGVASGYRDYYIYSVYVLLNLLLELSLTGFGKIYGLQFSSLLLGNGQMIFASGACVFGGVFLVRLLDVRSLSTKLYSVCIAVVSIWSAIFFASFIFSEAALSYIHVPMSLFSYLFVLLAIIYAVKKGNSMAMQVLVSWLFLSIGGVVFTLRLVGIAPVNLFTLFSLEMGVALEVTLLSLVLVKRHKLEKQEILKESIRLKDEFLGSISHELRTPINGITGSTELLKTTELNEEQRDYVSDSEKSTKQIKRLIEDILIYSEACSNSLVVHPSAFCLQDVIEEINASYIDLAESKGITMRFVYGPELPAMVSGDKAKVIQILSTLVDNAIKFTENGEVGVLCYVDTIPNGISGETVSIAFLIEDTGIGITEEIQGQIFEYFKQSDASYHRKHGGLGIGLAICKELVSLLNGTLNFTSEEGKGSCFSLFLPFENSSNNQYLHVVNDGLPAKPVESLCVLVVEDNVVNQKVLKAILKKLNITSECAEDGVVAVDFCSKKEYDLIFMDCQMPNMDGFEATRQIRKMERHEHTPIVAVTANATSKDKEACLESGMTDHMKKPVKIDEIKRVLMQYIKVNL